MKVLVDLGITLQPRLLSFQINLGTYIKDDSTELSVLVDRSVGGASIVDGQLELMLHRSILPFPLFVRFLHHA